MNIHEYQAKEILKKYGVPVPAGHIAFSEDEALAAAGKLSGPVYVVKAQIHAGGRGKGGGVKVAKSLDEVATHTRQMLGMTLITHQTGPQGKQVKKVLIEDGIQIERELYLGIVLDRLASTLVMMTSTEGGVEIERVSAESPEKILKVWIDPALGLMPYQARQLAYGLKLGKQQTGNAIKFMQALYHAFMESDASLAEINPLVVTKTGDVIALDAKITLDDSALQRHPEYERMRDFDEEDPLEVEAGKYDLNYIKLDGNVGCMVNGAGLAMATMDIIKLAGGNPANFLDVGGGANVDTVRNGFKIILSDKHVKAILINIFGGIVRCDRVANGVIEAARSIEINLPVVVRLEGTNAEEARTALSQSGLSFKVAGSFEDAARMVVETLK
jgi:succinyl-CoA synthetase beta subunit